MDRFSIPYADQDQEDHDVLVPSPTFATDREAVVGLEMTGEEEVRSGLMWDESVESVGDVDGRRSDRGIVVLGLILIEAEVSERSTVRSISRLYKYQKSLPSVNSL